jgi:predicted flap endonuclease-1-like 5' DNA nuclease
MEGIMKNKSKEKSIYKSPFLRFIVFLFFVFVPFQLFLMYFIEQFSKKMNPSSKKDKIVHIRPQTITIPFESEPGKKPVPTKKSAPAKKTSAQKPKDDLQLISGIGPKTREAMVDYGISSFSQIAAMNLEELNHLLENAGLRIKASQSWIDQARQLK